jgi:uncharacterized protein (TIGR03083 family)
MARAEILEALQTESGCLIAALTGLPKDDFDRATRCEPWSARELLAHVLVACGRLPAMLRAPEPASAAVSALQYFRNDRLGGTTDPERIETARADAARFPTGALILQAVATATRSMVTLARVEPPERRVRTRWDDEMLLDEYLKTRVLELAVHGLDLAAAVGTEPWLSEPAATVTEQVLTEGRAARELHALGWDERILIEKATGRAPLTEAEAVNPVVGALLWARAG